MDNQTKAQKEIGCFGMTEGEVEEEFQQTISGRFNDRLGFAMSILSDAQEAMAQGDVELARQWINKAKYHVYTARPKQVR